VFGKLGGRPAVVMSGRVHFYEGYTMHQVSFPVRVMQALGAKTLIVSNACGGMNPLFAAGDIMLVTDHINLMGDNPLIGPNDETLGRAFPDMSQPYDRALLALAEDVALEEKLKVQKGVFVAVAGPNLETAAEYRFLRGIGADVVGMSLIPRTWSPCTGHARARVRRRHRPLPGRCPRAGGHPEDPRGGGAGRAAARSPRHARGGASE
jgi:purine-nucleoside phosphorylase